MEHVIDSRTDGLVDMLTGCHIDTKTDRTEIQTQIQYRHRRSTGKTTLACTPTASISSLSLSAALP